MIRVSHTAREGESVETGKKNDEKWLEVGRRRKKAWSWKEENGKRNDIDHGRAKKIRKVRGCKKEEEKTRLKVGKRQYDQR